jgi:hypothetical protein
MSERDPYQHAVESLDPCEFGTSTKPRLVRDSLERVHAIEPTNDVWERFEELVYIVPGEDGKLAFSEATARPLVDEAVREAQRSGLPLTICFQNVVLKHDDLNFRIAYRRQQGWL